MHLRLLRLFLSFAALAWGISIVGVFLTWSSAVGALQGLGAKSIAYDPILDYWLRMAAGASAHLMRGFPTQQPWRADKSKMSKGKPPWTSRYRPI